MGNEIENYFKDNTNQTTAGIKWDAFKAFLRGHVLSYTSSKTRESHRKRQQLEYKIQIFKNKKKNEKKNECSYELSITHYLQIEHPQTCSGLIKRFMKKGKNPVNV